MAKISQEASDPGASQIQTYLDATIKQDFLSSA